MAGTEIELRCECSRRPLLAKAGRDENNLPFVHIKIYKQRKIYGEIVITEGIVRLRCRECFRWNTVRVIRKSDEPVVDFEQEPLPDAIPVT